MLIARDAVIAAALTMLAALSTTAVADRDRDDASITAEIQTRFAGDRTVGAASIKVETRNGEVVLSGVARDWTEKTCAEQLALKVDDVRTIKNEIVLRQQG